MGVVVVKDFLWVIVQITQNFLMGNFMENKNPKCNVEERIATLKFLHDQVGKGFSPRWFITYHLFHPEELLKPIKETNRPLGHKDRYSTLWYKDRYGNEKNLWKYLPRYKYFDYRRSDKDEVEHDTRKVRNVLLRKGYGIKRLNQTWKYKVPQMIFAHELGKYKLRYHTHLLIPEMSKRLNSVNSVENLFSYIRTKVHSISRWKKIEVVDLNEYCELNQRDDGDNAKFMVGYLHKETRKNINPIDYKNSIFT